MRRTLTSVGSVSPSPRRAFRPLVRPRVSQLLDSAYQYPVTVLIAGAGYGKSVALEHWLQGRTETIVRYNLREGMHGVFDFALGLAAALHDVVKIGPKAAANAVNSLQHAEHPQTDLAIWLDNACRKFSGTIVVDDFHVAAADDTRVADFVARLVERTGKRIRWVFSTRSACGLPITSWIAYGQSQMAIGERDLAFTYDEAACAAHESGAPFTDPQLNEVFAYTGGWPTAFTFALLSSQRTLDLEELRANTRDLSYQYLAEQVLLDLPPQSRAFLAETSVFERITVDVLERAEYAEPRKWIGFLKEYGPFVILDTDGGIRYHDLFRDFLRNELAKSDTDYRTAWMRAGRAYEAADDCALALLAYERAGARAEVVRILEHAGFALIERGRRRSVNGALQFVRTVPEFDDNPRILALRANQYLHSGSPDRAEVWYRKAIRSSRDSVERAELSLQFARELVQMNRADGIALLEPLLEKRLPAALSASLCGTIATFYSQLHDRAKAMDAMDRALDIASGVSDEEVRAVLLHQSAYILLMNGELKRGEEQAMRALEVAKSLELHGLSARIASLLYYSSAAVDNMGQALWWAKQMERAASDAGDDLLRFTAVSSMYEIEVDRGSADAITRYAETLRSFDSQRYIRASQTLLPAFALQAAWQRRFEESLQILDGSVDDQSNGYRRALRAAEIGLYAAAAGKRERAEHALVQVQEQLSLDDRSEIYFPKRHVRALLYAGLAYMLLGKMSTGNRFISDAERLSGQLSDRFKAFVRATRRMFVHVETRALDADVDEAFGDMQRAGFDGLARMLRGLPLPALDENRTSASLTKAEIDVLRAIERTADSKAAGADLGKSSHTIDFHVKSIMRKLHVKSRREAVAFARQHGIID